MAHAWALQRDLKKFQMVKAHALATMPLGSAALAGTTLPIDLTDLAQTLGFDAPALNSYDAVGERDSLVDFLQAAAQLGSHLSRLAEDVIYWSSAPVGLVSLSSQWSTGSSIMPNKRNPDIAELTRAKASLWMGDAYGVLTLLKGLATCYASDLHETKLPYLRVQADVQLTLTILAPFLSELTVNRQRAQSLLNQGHILATEIANHLTEQGIPFRDAYALVAELVELAESSQRQVHELSLKDIHAIAPTLDASFLAQLSFETTVEKRKFPGGSALSQVSHQMDRLRALIS